MILPVLILIFIFADRILSVIVIENNVTLPTPLDMLTYLLFSRSLRSFRLETTHKDVQVSK